MPGTHLFLYPDTFLRNVVTASYAVGIRISFPEGKAAG
jgi:hypothetical protein